MDCNIQKRMYLYCFSVKYTLSTNFLNKHFFSPKFDCRQIYNFMFAFESAYSGIHIQLLLVWDPHGNFETYSWIIYNCTV
jgi:hypothetical protein